MNDRFQDRYAKVGRVNTRYWQAGESGTPVLLLHGIGCSVLEWRNNISALAANHRVYAVDMVGSGLSDKPGNQTYSLSNLARFAVDFLSAQGIARAHIAGNSLGGRVALECALHAPDRVASLVLVAPAGVGREALFNLRLACIPGLGELLTRPNRFGLKLLWRIAFTDKSWVTDEMIEDKLGLARQPGAQSAFLKTLRGFLALGGFPRDQLAALHGALPEVRQPTLVIWGRQDRLLPVAHAEILRNLVSGSQIELFDNCGHLPQIESAQAFNRTVTQFMERIDRQR